jgi:hypothetical protein
MMIKRLVDRMGRAVLLESAPTSVGDSATATEFSTELARAEGWDIFDCGLRDDGSPRIEIQRLDSPPPGRPVFDTDHAAWDRVVAKAQAGSGLHLQALRLVDPTERKLIAHFCAVPNLPH